MLTGRRSAVAQAAQTAFATSNGNPDKPDRIEDEKQKQNECT